MQRDEIVRELRRKAREVRHEAAMSGHIVRDRLREHAAVWEQAAALVEEMK